jgi:hypothetical protein
MHLRLKYCQFAIEDLELELSAPKLKPPPWKRLYFIHGIISKKRWTDDIEVPRKSQQCVIEGYGVFIGSARARRLSQNSVWSGLSALISFAASFLGLRPRLV